MERLLLSLAAFGIAATVASAQVGSLINYGAIIKDSLRLENTGAYVRLPSNGTLRWGESSVGTLQTASLTAARSWSLPDESGTLLTTATSFSAAAASDATVSGTSSALDIQLKSGAVGTSEIADGSITNADISSTAAIAVSKLAVTQNNVIVGSSGNVGSLLAPGSDGQVLTIVGGAPTWTSVTVTETDPQVGSFAAGQVAFWDGTALTGSGNFFWDNANSRLGIGTTTPSVSLDVSGSARFASAAATTVVIGSVAADGKLRVDGSIRADGYRSADGTAATPAFRFTNSSSTGMFSPASNQVALATNGAERLRIDASGNVLVSGGHVALQNSDNTARELRLYEPSSSGSDYTALRAQSQAGSITYTLPATVTANGFLRTDASGNLSWQPADDDPSNDLTTSTTFAATAASDATVSGTYNALDIQFKSGSVGTSEIADGSITNADISSTAAIAVSKLAAGSNGQVLTVVGGVPTWASASSGTENDPEVSMTTAGAIPRWNGSALVDGSLSDDGNGTLSRSGNIALNPGSSNTLSTDGSLLVGQTLQVNGVTILGTFSAATPTVVLSDDNTAAALIVANEGSGGLISLGGSSGPYSLTFAKPTLTSDRTWTLPDLSGTVTVYTNTPTTGDVLTWTASGPQWQSAPSSAETDPQVGTFSTGQVAFWDGSALTGSSNLYWDNSNARFGIGTTSPQSKLHVHGSSIRVSNSTTGSTSGDGFAIELSGSNVQLRQNENASIQFRTNAGSGSDTVKMHLTADGRLVFYNPSSGSLYRIDLPNNSGFGVGRVRAQGYANYSSRAWKEQIRPIEGALDKVLRLTGVQYRWKPEYGGTDDIGFVMEDVAPVVPEVVDRHPQTGELTGMDYSRLTALLVEALKEEHRRNQELQQRHEEGRRQIEELRAEVVQLRQLVERLAAAEPITASVSTAPVTGAWLGDNIPNPHDGTTTIPYYVPSGVGRAQLTISDASGRTVRTVELPARDMWGQVTLDMSLLSSGRYEYRLVFDGRVVATKQMQLVK